ncbi:MAG: hypothetical protein HY510_03630 [Acidobacteria bacterium]|nr:hypothetical protein [Acidobacteriota bacterium]
MNPQAARSLSGRPRVFAKGVVGRRGTLAWGLMAYLRKTRPFLADT